MHLSTSLFLSAHPVEFDSMRTGDWTSPPLPPLILLPADPLLLPLLVAPSPSDLVIELFQCKQDEQEGS